MKVTPSYGLKMNYTFFKEQDNVVNLISIYISLVEISFLWFLLKNISAISLFPIYLVEKI